MKTVWTFETARFRIALELSPCEEDPADMFDDDEDVERIRDNPEDYFDARVAVYLDGREVGSDSLCGCDYAPGTFWTGHRDPDPANRNCAATNARHIVCHYFPDMVRQAIEDARNNLSDLPQLRRA